MQSQAGSRWLTGRGNDGRPGDERQAGLRVDRVVDLRAAVAPADEVDHDQIVAAALQRLVVEPAARREVGDEQPGVLARRADQPGDQLLALRLAEVDGDRALALVQPGPEQAVVAVQRHRPAGIVEAAADRIEADDVGAHLRQRHAAERHGDEGRALDDPHAGENALTPSSAASRVRTAVAGMLCRPTRRCHGDDGSLQVWGASLSKRSVRPGKRRDLSPRRHREAGKARLAIDAAMSPAAFTCFFGTGRPPQRGRG